MQEPNDSASLSHRHKVASPAAEGISEPTNAAIPRPVSQAEVAHLAYTYFAARGYEHGHAEEDWLRAERELRSAQPA